MSINKMLSQAKDPKELLELERQKLQQIMEEEHDFIREALNEEINRLNKNEQAELYNLKAEKEYREVKKAKDRQYWSEKQKVQ